jgi:hypothetical protein
MGRTRTSQLLCLLALNAGACRAFELVVHERQWPGGGGRLCYSDTWASGVAKSETCLTASYDARDLTLRFNATGDAVQRNAYDACNEDVFNQEVVEVFITSDVDQSPIEKYYEVELTPRGTPWIGLDSNPGGDRSNLTHVLQACNAVRTRIVARGAGWWVGEVQLPFALIGGGKRMPDGSRHFRANFFRVQMNPGAWMGKPVTRGTPCGPNNCTYLCASCPTTAQPDFHQSKFFGTVVLQPGAPPRATAFWDFSSKASPLVDTINGYQLLQHDAAHLVEMVPTVAPFARAAAFGYATEREPYPGADGHRLYVGRGAVPKLAAIEGPQAQVSVVAWVRVGPGTKEQHGMVGGGYVGGIWQESQSWRQWAIFMDHTGGCKAKNGLVAHISPEGGPSPGQKYHLRVITMIMI